MQIALIVEPQLIDPEVLARRFGAHWKLLQVETPRKALAAIQAALFDMVAISVVQAEDIAYEPIFSTLRLVAPCTRLTILAGERLRLG